MAHYKSDNQVRGNRYDGKYVKGPRRSAGERSIFFFSFFLERTRKAGFSFFTVAVGRKLLAAVRVQPDLPEN